MTSLLAPQTIPSTQDPAHVHAIAWSNHAQAPLLAIAIAPHQNNPANHIALLDANAIPFEDITIARRDATANSAKVTHLAWSPAGTRTEKLLAVGYDDGTLLVWSLDDRRAREDAEAHAPHALTLLRWSPGGEWLITADARAEASGELPVLTLWRVDATGRPTVRCSYRRPGVGCMRHAVFHTAGGTKKSVIDSAYAAAECPPFYVSGDGGVILYANELGKSSTVVSDLGAPVVALLYDEPSNVLVAITSANIVATFSLAESKPTQLARVKMSMGKEGLQSAAWASPGHLAIASADQVVRVTKLADDEQYILTLMDVPGLEDMGGEKLVTLANERGGGKLAAATREGHVVAWRHVAGASASEPEKCWEPLQPVRAGEDVTPLELRFGPREGLLAMRYRRADGGASVQLLHETVLRRVMHGEWALIQESASAVQLVHTGGASFTIEVAMRIVGCAIHKDTLVLWSGSQVVLFQFDLAGRGDVAEIGSFDSPARAAALWGESLYLCVDDRIEKCNFQGAVLSTMALKEQEGRPTCVHASGLGKSAYLVVGTDCGYVKAWDVTRREARQLAPSRRVVEGAASRVVVAQISCDGALVSTTLDVQPKPDAGKANSVWASATAAPWLRSSSLYVYHVEQNKVEEYDLAPEGREPRAHFWADSEPRLLAVETRPATGAPALKGALSVQPLEVVTLFATPDLGLRKRDSFGAEAELDSLISLQVPHLYFAGEVGHGDDEPAGTDAENSGGGGIKLRSRRMREFVGIKQVDAATQSSLVAFSYHLCCGNLDAAHKAVSAIKHEAVWENMAKMCVKTRRMDVAQICLGNMGHGRGARALRETLERQRELSDGIAADPAANEAECAATLAVELGMYDDAVRLFEEAGRLDRVNELLRARGSWDEALTLAEQKDRFHLKSTHYTYARALVSQGDIEASIAHFEKSGTHRSEVPRMLHDAAQMERLQAYVDEKRDTSLFKWWAQHCESEGDYDGALQYYQRAKDYLAIVRVLCFHDKLDNAAEVVSQCSNRAASHHLAQQYEERGLAKEAVYYYQRAHRFNHAVRLAKEHGMDAELASLALSAPQRMMLECARYFEARNMPDEAVALYEKGGNMSRALELCVQLQRFDALARITSTLTADSDPQLLKRCADFFLENGHFDKTIHLYAVAGDPRRAVDLCAMHSISVTEEMAEELCPPLGQPGAETAEARNDLLNKVAILTKRQGSYHLACKLFTQVGEKIKGMKCLLKSGDTDKIIFFAGVSRTKEIYILAANYLQTLDWRSDGEVMRNIVTFYTKAKAFEQLANFFDACSQVEIDEYRDYEKAAGALREAVATLGKAKTLESGSERLRRMQLKLDRVEAFVGARKVIKSDPDEALRTCEALLNEHDLDADVRVGDVFALLIEWYYMQQQYEAAYGCVEKMRTRGIELVHYLDVEMVAQLCSTLGQPEPPELAHGAVGANGYDQGEFVEEELPDEG